MSVKGSKEFEIAADAAAVMAAIVAVEDLPKWAGPYKNCRVEERYDDGRPKLLRAEFGMRGQTDYQLIAYDWDGDRNASWHLVESTAQKLQVGSFTLSASGRGTKVRFELELEPKMKVPGFLLKKVLGTVL
ncbi:SRPBCC family protein, partial [Aldersonia kunmingensis]|uniref:SRPBCC family protein n=1 Tax=Aldersonia kunmingensis TaxID=408066 RepID=UPI0008331755